MVQNKDSIKTYKALLTQTGTNAPTAQVIYNTLGDIVWTRNIAGDYIGTGDDLFKSSATEGTGLLFGNTNAPMNTLRRLNNNQVGLTTFTGAGALQDNLLQQSLVIIEVYKQYENYEY